MNWLLLAVVPFFFALNPVIGRALIDSFGPATLSVVRWSLSAAVIGVVAAVRGPAERWQAPPLLMLRIALLGAMGMGLCAYAAFIAAHTAEATNIALIYGCAAALVAAWEIGAGRQRASPSLLFGVAACMFGAFLILTRGHPGILRDWTFVAGDLWAAAGMLMFVVYTIALRRVPMALSAMPQFVVMAGAASLALVPFAAAEIAASGRPPLDEGTLPWLAAVVLFAGIGAFLGYNIALARNGPVLTSASLSLTPIFAALLAIALLGEQLFWYHGFALALVVTGLLLINRGRAVPATGKVLPDNVAPVPSKSLRWPPDRLFGR
ncbi:MAG: DMT family transporter [Hyphomicrobiaceae bacterium]|nr:DMT family transporter [Hyphomicrobiaceae bacterium]